MSALSAFQLEPDLGEPIISSRGIVSTIEWSDDWRTGVDWIDAQHREQVRRLGELFDGIASGSANVLGLLDQLIEGVTLHFKDEEAEMLRARYPDFDDHRREHIDLAAQIMETRQRLITRGSDTTTFELLDFLEMWLIGHIRDRDQPFGRYLRNAATCGSDAA